LYAEPTPHATHFKPEDGDSMFFRNVSICLQDYMKLQSEVDKILKYNIARGKTG
jgi:hypothetical protein